MLQYQKRKRKKTKLKTPLTLLSFKYSCYKTKKQKRQLIKSNNMEKTIYKRKSICTKCYNITSNITPQWWSYNTWIKQKRNANQQKMWSSRRSKIVSPICISHFITKALYNLYEPQIDKTQSFLTKKVVNVLSKFKTKQVHEKQQTIKFNHFKQKNVTLTHNHNKKNYLLMIWAMCDYMH
jgi:hypothetical protein